MHTPPTEIYTLSLHDALPIFPTALLLIVLSVVGFEFLRRQAVADFPDEKWDGDRLTPEDRKSTRLNSSHLGISYAVFCLKKKTNEHNKGQCSLKEVAAYNAPT